MTYYSHQPLGLPTFIFSHQLTQRVQVQSGFPWRRNLLTLDLSQNNISELADLPVEPNLGRVSLRENAPLRVAPGVLAKALSQEIILDLSETLLVNTEEAERLPWKITDVFVFRNQTGGYACKDVVNSEIKVTPSKFLPQRWCTCQAGWFGSGATCRICPENTFSDEMGLGTCKTCPPNSTAPSGSNKLSNCKCRFGDLHDGLCSCDKHQTLKDGNSGWEFQHQSFPIFPQ